MCLVSGAGNVAQFTVEKLIELGAKVVTLSDSSGYIYDEEGFNQDKLGFVKRLKNIRRGRIKEYVDKYSQAVYTEADSTLDYQSPLEPQGGLRLSHAPPRMKSTARTRRTW